MLRLIQKIIVDKVYNNDEDDFIRYDEEEEVEAPKKKKVEIVKPKMRSMLLSKLPKAKTDLNSMNPV